MILYTIIMLLIASANLPFMVKKTRNSWTSFIAFGFTIGMLVSYLICNL